MSNIFAELQQMSSSDSSIATTRRELNELVEHMLKFEWQEEQLESFALLRNLEVSTLKRVSGFMVLDDLAVSAVPDKFQHDSYGFVEGSRLIYSGRFVLPVKDVKGDVAGFVGYDKFEAPKYLDSKTYGYKAKKTMLYGMEELPKYYTDGYVIVPEGSMCRLWLIEHGFNSMAMLGSYLSPYAVEVLKRFGRKCIIVPDSDDTGNHYKRTVRTLLPEAQIWQTTKAKDIDDSTKKKVEEDGEEYSIRDEALVEQLVHEISVKLKNPFVRTEMI